MITVKVVLLVRNVVKFVTEIWILKHVVNELAGVSIPYIPFGLLPIGGIVGELLVRMKAEVERLPVGVTPRYRRSIDCWVKIIMVFEWQCVVVGSQRGSPYIEKIVNLLGRHLIACKKKVSGFELYTILVRPPVAIIWQKFWRGWRSIRWKRHAMLVAWYS